MFFFKSHTLEYICLMTVCTSPHSFLHGEDGDPAHGQDDTVMIVITQL